MSAHNELTPTLRFFCPACRAQLAVPAAMAGIEGPCPSCFLTIRSPLPPAALGEMPEAMTSPAAWPSVEAPVLPQDWMPEPPAAETADHGTPQFPPARVQHMRPIPAPVSNQPSAPIRFPVAPLDRGFKARLAIPPPEEPLDDSWKERHRDQRRSSRRTQRADKVANSFLQSRSFRVARVALILASGGMMAWLFHYLQDHQWRFPGMKPATANERQDTRQGKVRPVATDANELIADDDTEIPPASGTTPSAPVRSAPPVAGPPR